MSLCWNSVVVDRVTEQAKLAHGSGAVIWRRQTSQKSWSLLQNLSSTTTMRRLGSSSVSSSRITSPWWVRGTWRSCWTQSLNTLFALLATLTTGRSLRLVQRVPNRNGFEAWRQMAAENAPKTAGRRFVMLPTCGTHSVWTSRGFARFPGPGRRGVPLLRLNCVGVFMLEVFLPLFQSVFVCTARTAGRRLAMVQPVLQPSKEDDPAKFEEQWKSWKRTTKTQKDNLLVN